ncbi:hypothetical protein PO124_25135 [Bacillus licheniformis]|nr:hypothetical protein [Bacillus licheniformis]
MMLNMKRQARKKAEAAPKSSQIAWMCLGRSLILARPFTLRKETGELCPLLTAKGAHAASAEKPVHQEGEGGLLGFVLHPDLETVRRRTFIIHTKTGAI